jgi:hypothetical protein
MQAIAFSIESRVITRLGRRSSASARTARRPASLALFCFWSSIAGTMAEPIGEMPIASKAQAIVFAVY